ncbi:hypothetical protein ACFFQF_06865 [Haladaptatus pallidirubidus]|uniref:hypothetical protein n=1 Tax=Haladaptatus pallidirubidus TaxID=1008152 RepID=UPI0035E5E697
MLDYDSAWSNVDSWVRSLHDVWVQDGTAYLAQWDAGTWVVDVSNPKQPSHVAHFGGNRWTNCRRFRTKGKTTPSSASPETTITSGRTRTGRWSSSTRKRGRRARIVREATALAELFSGMCPIRRIRRS